MTLPSQGRASQIHVAAMAGMLEETALDAVFSYYAKIRVPSDVDREPTGYPKGAQENHNFCYEDTHGTIVSTSYRG